MQAKADITGRSFLISHMLQATALGAAAIAGGSRMKRNMDADSEKETISPTDALREAYDIKYFRSSTRWKERQEVYAVSTGNTDA